MRFFLRVAPVLLAAVLLNGCASSQVSNYQPMQGTIPRPDRIIVYDFAPTAAQLPPEVAIAGQGAVSPPATPAQLAVARTLGAETAEKLVAELQGMGLPAVQAAGQPAARVGDGLVVAGAAKGYGEISGSETIQGAPQRTAHEIALEIQANAQRQGWI